MCEGGKLKMKSKKEVTAGKFTAKLIIWIILNTIVFSIGFGLLLGIIITPVILNSFNVDAINLTDVYTITEKAVSLAITLTIIETILNILIVYIGSIAGVRDTLKRNTTSRNNINQIIKTFSVVVAICIIITAGVNI